jgi:hypothetical protein
VALKPRCIQTSRVLLPVGTKQINVASSRHPGRNQGHCVRCCCSDAVTLSSSFALASSALMSSTLKWLHRIQCGFKTKIARLKIFCSCPNAHQLSDAHVHGAMETKMAAGWEYDELASQKLHPWPSYLTISITHSTSSSIFQIFSDEALPSSRQYPFNMFKASMDNRVGSYHRILKISVLLALFLFKKVYLKMQLWQCIVRHIYVLGSWYR